MLKFNTPDYNYKLYYIYVLCNYYCYQLLINNTVSEEQNQIYILKTNILFCVIRRIRSTNELNQKKKKYEK